MKRLLIIAQAIVCLSEQQAIYAEIRNGYDNDIQKAQIKIDNLNDLQKLSTST